MIVKGMMEAQNCGFTSIANNCCAGLLYSYLSAKYAWLSAMRLKDSG